MHMHMCVCASLCVHEHVFMCLRAHEHVVCALCVCVDTAALALSHLEGRTA